VGRCWRGSSSGPAKRGGARPGPACYGFGGEQPTITGCACSDPDISNRTIFLVGGCRSTWRRPETQSNGGSQDRLPLRLKRRRPVLSNCQTLTCCGRLSSLPCREASTFRVHSGGVRRRGAHACRGPCPRIEYQNRYDTFRRRHSFRAGTDRSGLSARLFCAFPIAISKHEAPALTRAFQLMEQKGAWALQIAGRTS